MKITDSEKNKHRLISVGITTLSVTLLFLFFGLKYIIGPGKDRTVQIIDSTGIEVQLGKNEAVLKTETSSTPEKTEVNASVNTKNTVKSEHSGSPESILSKYRNSKTTEPMAVETPGTAEVNGTGTVSTEETESVRTPENNIVTVELGRRKVVSFPSMPGNMKEEGVVVVEIYVDKKGNVIEANPNGRGTNTASALLRAKAKQIALGIKFNDDQRTEEQKGSVKINFKFE